MIFIPQAMTDAWLQEDIYGGDVTTRALGIGDIPGRILFCHREGGCVSGIVAGRQMLCALGLSVTALACDGERVAPGQALLTASGCAAALHQGWKAVQNVLEWSCGVSGYLSDMLAVLRQRHPDGHIACTRKAIPGTKLLATQAVIAAGGLIHRAGCAETVLLFANHRRFLANNHAWRDIVDRLRREAPEKKIVVEADTPDEAMAALEAAPDLIQLDKFTPDQALQVAKQAAMTAPDCSLALTGGITSATLPEYLDCGIRLFVTSAPYYATPADIGVRLIPENPTR
jgi:molybdenum transport protein